MGEFCFCAQVHHWVVGACEHVDFVFFADRPVVEHVFEHGAAVPAVGVQHDPCLVC